MTYYGYVLCGDLTFDLST